MTTVQQSGSAPVQGALWGARPRGWSEYQEIVQRPLYEAVFDRIGIGPGTRLLDVGCGAGLACTIAAGRGATVTGIDAAAALIEVAKRRVPGGDFRTGEMEQLPYGDGVFDVVTGFNSFQYAARPVHALREARRVARPGAPVTIMTWGEAKDCEAAGEEAVRQSVAEAIAPFHAASGGYRLENKFRYLLATA